MPGVSRLPPDWQMSCAALLALAVIGLVTKCAAAVRMRRPRHGWREFACSPLLAPTSFSRTHPLSGLPRLLGKMALLLAGLWLCYWLWWQWLLPARPPGLVLGYLGVIPLLLLTNLIACLLTLLWAPGGRLLPHFHENPPAANSINDFWGRRWNTWTSDWFRLVLLQPLRRRPALAVFAVFLVSGLIHEFGVNVPFHLVTGRSLFGTMMLYYLLQAIGLLIERRLPRLAGWRRRGLFWLFVLGPVPLMMNEAMLRIMHLWPE